MVCICYQLWNCNQTSFTNVIENLKIIVREEKLRISGDPGLKTKIHDFELDSSPAKQCVCVCVCVCVCLFVCAAFIF